MSCPLEFILKTSCGFQWVVRYLLKTSWGFVLMCTHQFLALGIAKLSLFLFFNLGRNKNSCPAPIQFDFICCLLGIVSAIFRIQIFDFRINWIDSFICCWIKWRSRCWVQWRKSRMFVWTNRSCRFFSIFFSFKFCQTKKNLLRLWNTKLIIFANQNKKSILKWVHWINLYKWKHTNLIAWNKII